MTDDIAALLQSDELSYAKCLELYEQVNTRRIEVERRMGRINPKGPGPEMHKALETGAAEDIQALEDEHKRLSTEWTQTKVRLKKITELRNAAKAREAHENTPEILATLERQIKAVQAAQQALREAWSEAEDTFRLEYQARADAMRGHYKPEAASDELMALIRSVATGPCNVQSLLHQWARNQPDMLFENLGRDMAEAEQRAVA